MGGRWEVSHVSKFANIASTAQCMEGVDFRDRFHLFWSVNATTPICRARQVTKEVVLEL